MKQTLNALIVTTLILSITSIGALAIPTPHSHLTLKGDLRLRSQHEVNDSTKQRVRNRIRFRLGGTGSVSEQTSVKFGLATGSDNPRSTNQTVDKSFHTSDIRLDYAFVNHHLTPYMTLLGGQMKNPLWRPSDLLWDSDINPSGVSVRFHGKVNHAKWFVVTGYFTLDEQKEHTRDPYLYAVQPGLSWSLSDTVTLRTAIGVYVTQHVTDVDDGFNHSSDTNTLTTDNQLAHEFTSFVMSSQLDIHDTWGLPLIRPFTECVMNGNRYANNTGAIAGIVLGDKKVNQKGRWQSKVSYRYLESDAWLDILPDSDAYGGKTDIQGIELIVSYGLSKQTTLRLDYYSMDYINGDSDKQSLLQVDVSIKF